MALLIVTNALNMALALVFVLGFGWAVKGVAAATCAPSTAVWRSGSGWRAAS